MFLPLFLLRASAAHLYDDTQDRAACRFVLFKHVQKTGGRTLVAWLAQLPWVTYVPGSVAAALPRDRQVHPNSLRDFLQPYVQPTTQSNHTEVQLRFTSGRCGADHVRAPYISSIHGGDECSRALTFTRFDCAKRCLECKSCRFASFSARSNDCSLYSFCGTLAHDSSYETVDVSNSTRVFGKTLSAKEQFKYYFQRLGTGGFASLSHIPEDELEGSDAPPRELQPLTRDARPLSQRAGRIAVEIHGRSDHLPIWGLYLSGIEELRQSPSPCIATSVTIVREPLSYYRSKYMFYVANFPWTIRKKSFLEWLDATPNDQTKDLLKDLGSPYFYNATDADTVASLLPRIDIVATLDRFDDLVHLLCARLALPRCPCYKPQNPSPMTRFVQVTAYLQRKYNKSDLSPSTQFRQMALSREGVEKIGGKEATLLDSLRAQVHKVAWIDERVYAWASTQFSTIIAAEGLRRGRKNNTTLKCTRTS